MSPSIRGPESVPSGDRGLLRRLMPPPPVSSYLLEEKPALAKSTGSFSDTGEPYGHSSKLDSSPAAVIEALEAWKSEAAEKAARTESKILWSLLALESRISQSLEESAEARRNIGDFKGSPPKEWISQVAEVFAPTVSKVLASLEALENRVWEAQEHNDEAGTFLAGQLYLLNEKSEEARRFLAAQLELAKEESEEARRSVAAQLKEESEETRRFLAAQLELAQQESEEARKLAQEDSVEVRQNIERLVSQVLKSENTLAQRLEGSAAAAHRDRRTQIRLLSQLVDLQESLGSGMEALEARVEAASRKHEVNLEKLNESMESLESLVSWEQSNFSDRLVEVLKSVSELLEESKAQARLEKAQSDERVIRALETLEARIAQIQTDN